VPEGSSKAGPAPKGPGESKTPLEGSDEAMVTPFNRLSELVSDDHQFPFFRYPTIGT
jgi:hypothetical protein